MAEKSLKGNDFYVCACERQEVGLSTIPASWTVDICPG